MLLDIGRQHGLWTLWVMPNVGIDRRCPAPPAAGKDELELVKSWLGQLKGIVRGDDMLGRLNL
jgi:hypothetical protein